MALIHVVIPVYNAKRFLRETVASVLNQSCKDIDIVLVNDGSTDGSADLCDELAAAESRVSAIHQRNQGVSAARNAGIEYFLRNQAEGYVAFLDADDLWCEKMFTPELVQCLAERSGIDVCVFDGVSATEDLVRYSHPKQYQESCFDGGNGVIWKLQGHFCANLYSFRLLKKWHIRFREGLKYCEDKIFMLQCGFLAEKVQFMPQLMHIYRQNASSAMGVSSRIPPVEYYTPIIDGWIASNLFLNSCEPETGKSTNAGFILAGIYFLDMAKDHFKRWKHPGDLEPAKAHPYYYLFENMQENCVSPKQYKDNKLLLEHPLRYRWKYRIIGAVESVVRVALQIKPIHQFREKRKYPLTELPRQEGNL